jgi:hypothetical protein
VVVDYADFALGSSYCVDVGSVANIFIDECGGTIYLKKVSDTACPHGGINFKVNIFPMSGNQFIKTPKFSLESSESEHQLRNILNEEI